MSNLVKVEVKLELAENWVESRPAEAAPPIIGFIEAFRSFDEDLEIKQQNSTSCVLITCYERNCTDDICILVESILQDELDIMENDKAVTWHVIPYEKDTDSFVPISRPKQIAWRIHLVLADNWVLSHRDDESLPIDKFLFGIRRIFDEVKVEEKGLTHCSLIVPASIWRNIQHEAELILAEMEALDATVELDVDEAEEVTYDHPMDAEIDADSSSEKEEEQNLCQTELQKIDSLIGAAHFKDFAHELCAVAPQIIKHKTQDVFVARTYLFSIGDGCGLTTYLNHLAGLIHELQLFDFSMGDKVLERQADLPLQEMLNAADGCGMTRQIICFDISEWMDKIRSQEFKLFLQKLRQYQGNQLFAFRIPFVDEATRQNVFRGINDTMLVREVLFPPFSSSELRLYASELLSKREFSMSEDGWQVFDNKIIEEKSDGNFYGLETVKKVVHELLYQKHLSAAENELPNKDESFIRGSDIASIIAQKQEFGSAMEQLDRLIGIEPIKQRMLEILAQIQLTRKNTGIAHPSLHMRFVGNPGTGKTTVARILGMLLKEHGVLSKGQFFEYAGRDFCGRYIGETAPKTAAMCRDAYGSVLFIDESYSLYHGDKESNDYGREVIDTLIAQMENHRNDFIVIMAGYGDDMDILMSANAGLASRMPYVIEFPNYGREELYQIFMSMMECNFTYEPEIKTALREYFDSISEETISSKDFANARFVRNLFERTWGKAAIRHQMEPDIPFMLCACDFDKAAAEREFSELQQRRIKRIGF